MVVVAWSSASTLGRCIGSALAEAADAPVSVLVVDNDADGPTRSVLLGFAGQVRVLTLPSNAGFAGGVAAALDAVDSRYVLLLNDDAELAPGAVGRLLASAAATGPGGRVGAVQPAIALLGTEPALTNSTGNLVTPDGFGYDRDWLQSWPPQREPDDEPFGFCGAGALLDVAAVRAVGGMDASLFLYYEDTDLSWRLRLHGYAVRYCPGAVVLHHHGGSSGEGSDLFQFHNERNRLLVLARNATVGLALQQWLRFPLTTASLTLRVGPRRSRTVVRVRAAAGALRRLPAMLRKRARDRPVVARAAVQRTFVAPAERLTGFRS